MPVESRRLFIIALLWLGLSSMAAADTKTEYFAGAFNFDNDTHWFTVQLVQPAVLAAYSQSGASGGFPVNLTLFGPDGAVMQQQSGSPGCFLGYSVLNADNICNDAYLLEPPPAAGEYLAAGTYVLAVTQSNNSAIGDLTYDFLEAGGANQNFTNAEGQCGAGTLLFCDPATLTRRNAAWNLTFSITAPSGTAPQYVIRDAGSSMTPAAGSGVPPLLTLTLSHSGNFNLGQTGAVYSLVAGNDPSGGVSNQTITVTESLPAGLSLVSMAGTNWTCAANVCSRADVLNPGATYPAITVTANVSSSAAASVTNMAGVTGQGLNTALASDPTSIYSLCDLKQTGSVTVADVQLIINEALGVSPVVYDLSGTGVVNVVDVQIEINAALGLGCAAK